MVVHVSLFLVFGNELCTHVYFMHHFRLKAVRNKIGDLGWHFEND
jgi:hypothetical protein